MIWLSHLSGEGVPEVAVEEELHAPLHSLGGEPSLPQVRQEPGQNGEVPFALCVRMRDVSHGLHDHMKARELELVCEFVPEVEEPDVDALQSVSHCLGAAGLS